VLVPFDDPHVNVIHSAARLSLTLWRMSWQVRNPNQPSTWLIQLEPVGAMLRRKRGVGQVRSDGRCLERVPYQVDIQITGTVLLNMATSDMPEGRDAEPLGCHSLGAICRQWAG